MRQVAIIGCGVVGAAIAYELSRIPNLSITVLDRQPPAQASTGAALGVLMGIISQKFRGNAWELRQRSIRRYESLIPELESLTGHRIPFNQKGILRLCLAGEDLSKWQELVATRRSQGWQLELWDIAQLKEICPQVQHNQLVGAVYSPQDRQVDPISLTLALVTAAQKNGVNFKFNTLVENLELAVPQSSSLENFSTKTLGASSYACHRLQTTDGPLVVDWVVIAAGLGSTSLTTEVGQPIDIRPVLGQALQLRLQQPLGNPDFQPVITGDDIHIVPLDQQHCWVGATVEFAADGDSTKTNLPPQANSVLLQEVLQGAIAFCPALTTATIVKTWTGLRPRPYGRPAPIIGPLPGYNNVLLATGHYRNGVLLAPATAHAVCEAIAGV